MVQAIGRDRHQEKDASKILRAASGSLKVALITVEIGDEPVAIQTTRMTIQTTEFTLWLFARNVHFLVKGGKEEVLKYSFVVSAVVWILEFQDVFQSLLVE